MKLIRLFVSHLFDFIALLAIVAIVHGIAMIHKPSAWIAGGLLVLAVSVFISYFEGKTSGAERR